MYPPVLVEHEGEIVIVGDIHRDRLAHDYGARRMPCYVPRSELAKVLKLLPDATLHWEG